MLATIPRTKALQCIIFHKAIKNLKILFWCVTYFACFFRSQECSIWTKSGFCCKFKHFRTFESRHNLVRSCDVQNIIFYLKKAPKNSCLIIKLIFLACEKVFILFFVPQKSTQLLLQARFARSALRAFLGGCRPPDPRKNRTRLIWVFFWNPKSSVHTSSGWTRFVFCCVVVVVVASIFSID